MVIFTEEMENEYIACSPSPRRWTGLAYSFAMLEAFFLVTLYIKCTFLCPILGIFVINYYFINQPQISIYIYSDPTLFLLMQMFIIVIT